MKQRIGFVGFGHENPTELATLQGELGSFSDAWDVVFFAQAEGVLDALAIEPCAAIVTHTQLRGMSGTELLHRVGRRQPQTLRFVVGDVADQESILHGIGGTHHFISRPYDARSLLSTVQRSLALDACLSTEQLRRIVPQLKRMPSLPATYFELLKQVESPNSTVQSIADVVATDPAVLARLLQMVNSAAFALAQKVTDPVHAVSVLGVETVKSLVLCLQVFAQNDQAKQAGVSLEDLWQHSSLVAHLAQQIAKAETNNVQFANEAFTAGLLHDVGRILFASNLPKEYAQVFATARQQKRTLSEAETAQFGVSHAQVGAYLLGLWGLPASVVEAAALHHVPSQTPAKEFSVLTAVHVANVIAHEQNLKADGLPLELVDTAYLEQIGHLDKLESWRRAIAGEPEPVAPPVVLPPPILPPVTPPPVPVVTPVKSNSRLRILAPAFGLALVAVSVWFIASRATKHPTVQARVVNDEPTPGADRPGPDAATTLQTQPEPVPVVSTEITPPAPQPTAPPPKPAVAQTPPTNGTPVPALEGFDSVRVQGILFSDTPSVIMNGRVLMLGEKLNEVRVIRVQGASVTLRYRGEDRVIRLK